MATVEELDALFQAPTSEGPTPITVADLDRLFAIDQDLKKAAHFRTLASQTQQGGVDLVPGLSTSYRGAAHQAETRALEAMEPQEPLVAVKPSPAPVEAVLPLRERPLMTQADILRSAVPATAVITTATALRPRQPTPAELGAVGMRARRPLLGEGGPVEPEAAARAAAGSFIERKAEAVKRGFNQSIEGLLASAVKGGTPLFEESAEFDPDLLDRAVASIASFATPASLLTFAVGNVPGQLAARGLVSALVKRFGPDAVRRGFAAAVQSTAGSATSFAGYEAISEALKQTTAIQRGETGRYDPGALALAAGRGALLGTGIGAAGRLSAPLLQYGTEVGILASVPPLIEGHAPTLQDVMDAGVLVGAFKVAGRLTAGQRTAVATPKAQRTPEQAQVVASIPLDVQHDIAIEALLTTRAALASARAERLMSQPARLESLPDPTLPTQAEAGLGRRMIAPPERPQAIDMAAERGRAAVPTVIAPSLPAGPLLTAREPTGELAEPVRAETPTEARQRNTARFAAARRLQAYQDVPSTFGAFVAERGRPGILPNQPGFMDLRREWDDIRRPLYLVQGPRFGQWEVVNRLTHETVAQIPNRALAQLEANRMDLARMRPLPPESFRPLRPSETVEPPVVPPAEAERPEPLRLAVSNTAPDIRPEPTPIPSTQGRHPQEKPITEVLGGASEGFDPSDVDHLAKFVITQGGIAPSPTGDLRGEYAAIPLRFKNRNGLTPDKMGQAVSEAAGRAISDAEVLDRLAHLGRLRAEKTAKAKTEAAPPIETEELRALPDEMTGMTEAEALKVVRRPEAQPEFITPDMERAERDVADFQLAARDYFSTVGMDDRPTLDVLDTAFFGRFGGTERITHDLFGGHRDLVTAALETAKQDVVEGRVQEERAAYGRLMRREASVPVTEGHEPLLMPRRPPLPPEHPLLRTEAESPAPLGTIVYQTIGGRDISWTKIAGERDGYGRWRGVVGGRQKILSGADVWNLPEGEERKADWTFRYPDDPSNLRRSVEGRATDTLPGAFGTPRGLEGEARRIPTPPRTPKGDQTIIPSAEARQIPATPHRVATPQRPLQDMPRLKSQEPTEQPRLPRVEESRAEFGKIAPATFLGYQEGSNREPLALYNLIAPIGDHPVNSTVTARTLREAGLELPETPTFEEWRRTRGVKEARAPDEAVTGAELRERAKRQYGTTEDWREAGWILPDGTMLDLSGRHYATGYEARRPMPGQPDYLKGQRVVDHREGLVQLVGREGEQAERMRRFAQQSGAIRFMPNVGISLEFGQHPTDAQLGLIARAARQFDDHTLSLDIYDDRGDIAGSIRLRRPTVHAIQAFLASPRVEEGRAPYTPHQPAPPFFSGLQRLIEKKMPAAAPAAMVRNIIKQAKPEEVKWTGLDDWLAAKSGTKVTKQEVGDFLRQNEVRVEEVMKGGGEQEALERADREFGEAVRREPRGLPEGYRGTTGVTDLGLDVVQGRIAMESLPSHLREAGQRLLDARRARDETARVGTTEIPAGKSIVPANPWTVTDATGRVVDRFANEASAKKYAADHVGLSYRYEGDNVRLHAIDITPEMRRSIMQEGQALFEGRKEYTFRDDITQQQRDAAAAILRELGEPPPRTVSAEGVPSGSAPSRRAPLKRGAGVTPLGAVVGGDIATTGRIVYRTQRIASEEDLARLGQIASHPQVEHFRIIYTKGDQAVAEEIISSRLPGSTATFLDPLTPEQERHVRAGITDERQLPRQLWEMRERMRRLGADGYWPLHNHPAGTPKPSDGDLAFTDILRKGVPGFKGHIIIDDGAYGVIRVGTSGVLEREVVHADFARKERQPVRGHPLLGRPMDQGNVAQLGADVEATGQLRGGLALFRSGNGTVRALEDLPYEFLASSGVRPHLQKRMSEYGAGEVVLYLPESHPEAVKNAAKLMTAGVVTDVRIRSEPTSLRDRTDAAGLTGRLEVQRDRILGALQAHQTVRIREEPVPYSADPGLLRDLAEYGQEIRRTRRDFDSWADAMRKEFGERVEPYLGRAWDDLRRTNRASTTPSGITVDVQVEKVGPPSIEGLTQPQLVLQRHQQGVEAAGETLLAEGGIVRDKSVLLSDQILDMMVAGKLNLEILERALPLGMTVAEFGQELWRPAISDAARRLQVLSVLERRINKLLVDGKVPESARAELDATLRLAREVDEGVVMQAWWRRLDNLRRGLLVSQLATAVRNFESQVGRLGMDVLDLGLQRGIQKAAGVQPTANPWEAIGAISEVFRQFKPEEFKRLRGEVDQILESFPRQFDRLFGTYASDVANQARERGKISGTIDQVLTASERVVNLLNWANKGQEFIVRRAVFQTHLDEALQRRRLDLADLVSKGETSKIPEEAIKASVEKALDLTFATPPKYGTAAWHFVKLMNQGAPLTTSILPFPRFMTNALRFQYEFSPLGFLPVAKHLISAADRRAVLAGDAKAISRATIGSAMFLASYALRVAQDDDNKWYEITVLGETRPVDVRPFNPFASYLFIAELTKRMLKGTLYNKLNWNEILQGVASANLRAGTGLYALEQAIAGIGELDNLKKAREFGSRAFGEYLAGFLTPFQQIKDFLAPWVTDLAQVKDRNLEPFLAPLKDRLPGLVESGLAEPLPPAYSPTRAEPMQRAAPVLRQLTGITLSQEKNPAEKELARFQFDRKEIMPQSGDPLFDNLWAKHMGQLVEERLGQYVEGESYRGLSEGAKMKRLKDRLIPLRALAKSRTTREMREMGEGERLRAIKEEAVPRRERLYREEREERRRQYEDAHR